MDISYQIMLIVLFIGGVIYIRDKYYDTSNPILPWRRGNPFVLLIVFCFIVYHILDGVFHNKP
jgi:hypothetical protein